MVLQMLAAAVASKQQLMHHKRMAEHVHRVTEYAALYTVIKVTWRIGVVAPDVQAVRLLSVQAARGVFRRRHRVPSPAAVCRLWHSPLPSAMIVSRLLAQRAAAGSC